MNLCIRFLTKSNCIIFGWYSAIYRKTLIILSFYFWRLRSVRDSLFPCLKRLVVVFASWPTKAQVSKLFSVIFPSIDNTSLRQDVTFAALPFQTKNRIWGNKLWLLPQGNNSRTFFTTTTTGDMFLISDGYAVLTIECHQSRDPFSDVMFYKES